MLEYQKLNSTVSKQTLTCFIVAVGPEQDLPQQMIQVLQQLIQSLISTGVFLGLTVTGYIERYRHGTHAQRLVYRHRAHTLSARRPSTI